MQLLMSTHLYELKGTNTITALWYPEVAGYSTVSICKLIELHSYIVV